MKKRILSLVIVLGLLVLICYVADSELAKFQVPDGDFEYQEVEYLHLLNLVEHSIANMTLLSISLFFPHGDAVSFAGFVNNLTWVTLGNIIGGGIFVGGMYWLATYKEKE